MKSIQNSLANRLCSTFSNRAGKPGAPLIPIGHYAGVVDLGKGMALALHTDGVGTKLQVAQEMNRFDTVGIDCIAMTVNDLVCIGAEPVSLLDYIALEREDDWLVTELTKGLIKGAELSGAAIVGGETAILGEMVRGPGGRGFDLVSMGAGLLNKKDIIDGSDIKVGDVVLAAESSGLHSNGFTLARKILRGHDLHAKVRTLGSTLGDALLAPTRIYVKPVLEASRKCDVHGIAHITGGAFSKLTRLSGERGIGFALDIPPPQGIFSLLQEAGRVEDREMYRTFNMGIGVCLVLPEEQASRASRIFARHSMESWIVGRITRGRGVSVNGVKVA